MSNLSKIIDELEEELNMTDSEIVKQTGKQMAPLRD
jgi:tetrahydromethanopterin S-methyltransferase subunit G